MDPNDRTSPCILVVDDDEAIRYSLARWIKERGARVIEAANTRDAVEMLRDASFIDARVDGLLVDYQLPDATGCRVILEFADEFPGVPMALMTGKDDLSLELWLRSRGIPLFRKPLDIEALETWLGTLGQKIRAGVA
jgi:two-component system OmpR family response regulator